MDQILVQILTELGLSKNQTIVYLALLETGVSTVQNLARRAGLKRTSLYFILEELARLGLVYMAKVNKRTHYEAISPAELLEKFKSRVADLEGKMAVLNATCNKSSKGSRVLFFDSEEGFKQIWRRVLTSGAGEYLIITDPRQMLEFVRKRYITNQIIKEKIKRGIRSRQLLCDSLYAREVIAKDQKENRVSRLLPGTTKIPFTIIIFGDNVAFISPDWENVIFLVESEALAQTQRAIFELAWKSGLQKDRVV